MVKKDLNFYRSFLIMFVSFLFFGFFIADMTRDMWLAPNIYYNTPGDWSYRRSFEVNLTGDHEYRIYMFVDSPAQRPLTADFIFVGNSDLDFSYTLDSGGDSNEIFFEPFYLTENVTLRIWGTSIFEFSKQMEQQIRIYQDLPGFLIYNQVWISIYTLILLGIWLIANNAYERVFEDIKIYKKNHMVEEND